MLKPHREALESVMGWISELTTQEECKETEYSRDNRYAFISFNLLIRGHNIKKAWKNISNSISKKLKGKTGKLELQVKRLLIERQQLSEVLARQHIYQREAREIYARNEARLESRFESWRLIQEVVFQQQSQEPND